MSKHPKCRNMQVLKTPEFHLRVKTSNFHLQVKNTQIPLSKGNIKIFKLTFLNVHYTDI